MHTKCASVALLYIQFHTNSLTYLQSEAEHNVALLFGMPCVIFVSTNFHHFFSAVFCHQSSQQFFPSLSICSTVRPPEDASEGQNIFFCSFAKQRTCAKHARNATKAPRMTFGVGLSAQDKTSIQQSAVQRGGVLRGGKCCSLRGGGPRGAMCRFSGGRGDPKATAHREKHCDGQ